MMRDPAEDPLARLDSAALALPGVDQEAVARVQQHYLAALARLWSSFGESAPQVPDARPADRRFAAPPWRDGGVYEFMSQLYLLNARTLTELGEAVQGDEKTRQKVRFAIGQWVDAMSPANFLATNPEAQRRIIDTHGESVKAGIENLLRDMARGRIAMTDESRFEIGVNVALSEGDVVYENEFFQLIQYAPRSERVGARPLLMIPPCINKYYILDLQPANSLVRYAVEQGSTVFMVSWRNPMQDQSAWTWDDYVEQGAIRAIEVVRDIARTTTGSDTINVLGFCVGGTIAATALAVLAARGERPAESLTLLTTLLDFARTGVLDVFVDEPQVRLRESTIGHGGLMPARDLATTFSFLRPNDLVWPYVVGNYLKGETPPAFDLLYWNADSTNLPGPMYAWYLRHTYLENNLCKPGRCTVAGTPVDLRAIECPVYVYGSREDHIVPWESAYASTRVLSGMDRSRSCFVLGASGHIAGVINPAAAGKRHHWIGPAHAAAVTPSRNGIAKTASKASSKAGTRAPKRDNAPRFPAEATEWLAQAEQISGSWWPHWSTWLAVHHGNRVAAPKRAGGAGYRPIEPAPGRYVKVRAV